MAAINMAHTQNSLWLVFAVIAGIAWTVVWLHIWFMLGRMLRWKYLEMKSRRSQVESRRVENVVDRQPVRSPGFVVENPRVGW